MNLTSQGINEILKRDLLLSSYRHSSVLNDDENQK